MFLVRSAAARAFLVAGALFLSFWPTIHGQAVPSISAYTFGGSDDDAPTAMAVDAQGNVFITGTTASSNLPGTANAFQKTRQGDRDGFVAKFDASGQLLWASYLGGNDAITLGKLGPIYDTPSAIAVDPQGNVYVAGETTSTNFPVVSAFQASKQRFNDRDGFLTKIDPTGIRLLYSTYLGSSATSSMAKALAVGVAGDAFVAVQMESRGGFPVTNQLNANANIVIGRINPVGSPVWFTRAGVPNAIISGLALDDSGQVTVAAYSSAAPCPSRVLSTSTCGATYAFKLDTSGARKMFEWNLESSSSSTFAGDIAKSLDQMVVSGRSDEPLPVVNAWQPQPDGTANGNGFVSLVGERGNSEVLSYMGGAADHRLHVASDLFGSIHLAFDTTGMDWVPAGLTRPQHPDGPFFASSDNGQSFSWSSNGLTGSVLSMGIDPNRGYLYASTLTGIYRSIDHGLTWRLWDFGDQSLWRSIAFVEQRPLAVDPTDPTTVYAAAGHLLRIEGDGRRVTVVRPGGVGFTDRASNVTSIAVSPHDRSVWVTDTRNVYVSFDRGVTWANRGAAFPTPNGLALDPIQPGVVYVYGAGGARRSADAGAQWSDLSLPRSTDSPGMLLRVHAIAVDPTVPNRVYAGLSNGLKISEDAGRTWVPVPTGRAFTSFALSTSGPSRIYATAATSRRLVVSNDRGVTWAEAQLALLRTAPAAVAIDPTDPARVYVSNGTMNPATFLMRLRPAGRATYLPTYASYAGDGELRDLAASVDGETIAVLRTGGNVRVIRIGR